MTPQPSRPIKRASHPADAPTPTPARAAALQSRLRRIPSAPARGQNLRQILRLGRGAPGTGGRAG